MRSVAFDERSTIQSILEFCSHTTIDPEAIPPDAKPIPVLEQLVPTVTDYIAAETKIDVGTDARATSPKDVSNRQDIRISYYNVQTSTPGTPTNHTAEAKQSMSRHLQLVATDEELREQTQLVDADENFPPVYFDIPQTQHTTDEDDPLIVFLASPGEVDNMTELNIANIIIQTTKNSNCG